MGKTLSQFFGKTPSKTIKLKILLGLTLSRITVLRNHRSVRFNHARNDVLQLLQLGHVERALLRVELVIMEQNMLDVFVILEGYCHLLTERILQLEHKKECPDELREAISSLIFAASRCGDLPELQEIRRTIASKFGKEFTSAATELRNNCGVNLKVIQKLSTQQPSLETKRRVAREIAGQKGIKLEFDEPFEQVAQLKNSCYQGQPVVKPSRDIIEEVLEVNQDENFSTSQKYTDVVSAAEAAFESAAYAAVAARAAMELSRLESLGKGPDNQTRGGGQTPRRNEKLNNADDDFSGSKSYEKLHRFPIDSSGSEPESESEPEKEEVPEKRIGLLQKRTVEKFTKQMKRSSSSSSSVCSELNESNKGEFNSVGIEEKEILFDSDNEKKNVVFESRPSLVRNKQVLSGEINENGVQMQSHYSGSFDEGSTTRHNETHRSPPYQRINETRYCKKNNSCFEEGHKGALKSGADSISMKQEARIETQRFCDKSEDCISLRLPGAGRNPLSVRTRRDY